MNSSYVRTILYFIFFATVAVSQDAFGPRKCRVRNCTDVEDLIWAKDGHTCRVFRNGCEYAKISCENWEKKWPDLKRVTRNRCQKFCNRNCLTVLKTVCAKYKASYRTFINACEMNSYACTTGELYMFVSKGECESNAAPKL